MKHFIRKEFRCKCGCGFDVVDYQLATVLDAIREHFGEPVSVTSGCRCYKHNKAIGGAPSSQHMLGKAADIVVRSTPASDVASWVVNNLPEATVYTYPTWTHIDVRTK